MKKLVAVFVILALTMTGAAFAKGMTKDAGKAAMTAECKAGTCAAKDCKFMCEKCGNCNEKGGKCPTCKVAMKKCDDKTCKTMKDTGKTSFGCKHCGTTAEKAGKCPKCGMKMEKMEKMEKGDMKKAGKK